MYRGQGTNFSFTGHTALHWAAAKGQVIQQIDIMLCNIQMSMYLHNTLSIQAKIPVHQMEHRTTIPQLIMREDSNENPERMMVIMDSWYDGYIETDPTDRVWINCH